MAKPGVQSGHVLVNGGKDTARQKKIEIIQRKIEKFLSSFKKDVFMCATIPCVKHL